MQSRSIKRISISLAVSVALILISWGEAGHRNIAAIAENHLTSETKEVVKRFLGDQTLADVASWADEVRDEPKYRHTASWHFLNLPLGLNHEQFIKYVEGLQSENIYSAIVQNEAVLTGKDYSFEQRNEALKFLIHLLGDAHQPMHVSHKEDKGGNTIQVQFNGKGTNLHRLWDSQLVEHEQTKDNQRPINYDTATTEVVKQWQSDPPMQWLWESYQISSQLYKDVENNKNIGQAYFNKWIPVIHKRIDQAGIRLAGELNRIFNNQRIKVTKVTLTPPTPSQTPDSSAVEVELRDLPNLIGKTVMVQGKVYGLKQFEGMTLVNLGAPYPNQLATIVLKAEAKKHFGIEFINGKTLTVVGTVSEYKGKPQIVVTDSDRLSLSEK